VVINYPCERKLVNGDQNKHNGKKPHQTFQFHILIFRSWQR